MEKLAQYRQIIKDVLIPYTQIPYSHGELVCKPVFDEINDSYILMTLGWDRKARVHGCLVHLDIIDGKIWVQRDETEDGVTYESVLAESTELNCSRSSNDSRFKPDFSLYNGGDVSICCSGLLEGTLRNIPKLFF